MCWPVALFGGAIVLIIASLTRYVSMGSILGSLGILVLLIILTIVNGFPPIYLAYSVLAVIMIVYQHRSNIGRLQTRTELRIGDKVKIKKPDSMTQPPGAN
jgi:glycerol-3-phosphate acyltransferase PlsY